MKSTSLFVFLFLFFIGINYSQDDNSISIPSVRNNILERIPSTMSNGVSERTVFRFADQSAVYAKQISEDGDVIQNLDKYEKYINQVLERVMPDELLGDSIIHAYLVNDGSYNASMTASGLSFFNIGLFAQTKDESTLAGIIAHELAHYYLMHSFKSFLKFKKKEFRPHAIKTHVRNAYSVNHEIESDELAMKWMQKAGYSLEGLKDAFLIMKNNEDKLIARLEEVHKLKATTHPLSSDRLDRIDQYIKDHSARKGGDAFVDQQLFNELNEVAKPIILTDLLRSYDYDDCIELAFKFHLEDPGNTEYIHMLMEAIRRKCYFNPDFWNKNFILSRYYGKTLGTGPKPPRTDCIFDNFPHMVLNISEEDYKNLPGVFYWNGEQKFKTNEEAFTFFFQLSQKFGNHEGLLSNALSYDSSVDLMNKSLDEYLSHDNIKYREYAEAIRNNNIYSSLPSKKLLVFSDFSSIIKQGKEEIAVRPEFSPITKQLDTLYQNVVKDDSTRIKLVLDNLKEKNLESFRLLQELELLSFRYTISKNKILLHILDPRYYVVFLKYGVNEIEFLNSTYVEVNKSENSVDSYKEVITQDYFAILNKLKSTRYFEIFATSVRLKENAVMKIKHYGGDNELSFKKPSYPQLLSQINYTLKTKDEAATIKDREYKKLLNK